MTETRSFYFTLDERDIICEALFDYISIQNHKIIKRKAQKVYDELSAAVYEEEN